MYSVMLSTLTISSVPALATALRSMDDRFVAPARQSIGRGEVLVPLYRINNASVGHPSVGYRVEQEAEATAYVVSNTADRLRRLGTAYGEWDTFDAPAYFDLSVAQTEQLVKLVERVNTVHVTFLIDLLLPSFQRAVAWWAEEFLPVYQQRYEQPALASDLFQRIQPTMVDYWQSLTRVMQQTRMLLSNDVGFLATNGAQEERERWRRWWSHSTPPGLDSALLPELARVPTFTLSFDFPLPANRQPDRLRRLRRSRDRRRWRQERG